MKSSKLKKYIPILVMTAIVVGAVIFVSGNGAVTAEMLLSYTPENKWLAALVIILLYALKSQTVVILYAVIAAAAGMLFDLPAALLINAVGTVVCISVPYVMGRLSDGVLLAGVFARHPKIRRLYDDNRDNAFLAAMIMRAFKLSNDLLGLLFGSLKVPYFEYLAGSFIGILPAMVLYTVLGNDLDFASAPVLICLAAELAGIAGAWILLRVRRRKKKKSSGLGA